MEKYRLVRRRLDQKIADDLLAECGGCRRKIRVRLCDGSKSNHLLATVSDEDVEARYQQVRERAQK